MKTRMFMIGVTFAFSLTLGAQSVAVIPPSTLDDLVKDYYQASVTAAFGTFTYSYGDLPSPFSRWLEDELGSAISKSGKLKLFNRSAAAAMDPNFKSVYGDFFQETGVDALLAGHFDTAGKSVKIRLELTSLTDGTLIGTTDVQVPLAAIPPGLQIRPLPQVQDRASMLSGVLASTTSTAGEAALGSSSQAPPRLAVTASTDRGKGGVYREGENLVVLATVNQSAYVRIYHIDVNNNIQRIYPNSFGGGDGLLVPGDIVRIPGESEPFAFRIGPPFGTEFIKIIASTKPFSSNNKDFTDLAGDPRSVIAEDLPSEAGDATYAEALATYVIVPAQ